MLFFDSHFIFHLSPSGLKILISKSVYYMFNVEFVDRYYSIGSLYYGWHCKKKMTYFTCLVLKRISIQISLLVYLYIQIKENKCSKTNVKPLQALCLVINQNISPNNQSLFVNIEINIW